MAVSRIFALAFAACCILLVEGSQRSKRATEACPTGYTLQDNKCYKLYTTLQDFTTARATCQSDGGDLVSISDQTTHEWIVANIFTPAGVNFAFIGYSDAALEGTWLWSDGTTNNVFNSWGVFASRQLPDVDTNYNCAGLSDATSTNGDWLDGKCTDAKPFICARDRVQWSCNGQFSLYGDKCYRLVRGRKTWAAAKLNCEAEGSRLGKTGTLASIPDQGTQDFVTGLMTGRRWAPWIGATDDTIEGTWTWTDGTAFSYSQWTVLKSVQQPAGGNAKNCAAIEGVQRDLFGGWNDFKCTMRTWSICQVGANEIV